MPKLAKIEPGLVLLLILVTVFWAPAIFEHKTIIHGDFPGHGLPLMDLHFRALRDPSILFWQDKIYGGHPLFAEGQGGFAHPVNMLFAWVVAPLFGVITAENLFHWFCMVFGGAGILLICRQLGLGPWAACFGAVAGVFSLYNLNQQQNETVSAAAAWVSWCIWAIGRWIDRPSLQSAAMLAVILTLEFFCGYPESLDGALLYGLMMLAARAFDPAARANWGRSGRTLIATGAVGIVIALGLSAVQLLPELELVLHSHRSGGNVVMPIQLPLQAFIRGFLFTDWNGGSTRYMQVIGSILICMLASLTLIVRSDSRVKGHIAGTLLLIILGMGQATALFRFIYDYNLLPQLHFYRLVFIYLNDANVTVAVLAAVGVEAVGRWRTAGDDRGELGRPPIWMLGIFLLLWVGGVYHYRLQGAPVVQYAVVVAAVAATALCVPLRAARWLPLFLTGLLVIEIAATKLWIFHFADQSLLDKPASIAAIQAEPDWRDYKIYGDNRVGGYTFAPPNAPGLEAAFQRQAATAAGLANLRWGLASLDGALALAIGRRWAIEPRLEDEVYGRVDQPPGTRLIDLLGIRWIIFDQPAWAPAVRTLWHNAPDDFWILQDDAARPRFQIYPGCQRAESADQALAVLTKLTKPALIIEDHSATDPCGGGAAAEADETAPLANLTVIKAKSTRYRFDISVDRPAWFFLADTNYPGWVAFLDGKEVPIYSAQILGKAVALPAGRHDLRIWFRPVSFYVGLIVTLLTAISAAVLLIRIRRPARPG